MWLAYDRRGTVAGESAVGKETLTGRTDTPSGRLRMPLVVPVVDPLC